MKARIAGIGAYAPERVVTNDQLSEIVDTSDEWIRSRTGISERRISYVMYFPFGASVTGGAWLSSARVVRCWVKSRNERNPCP